MTSNHLSAEMKPGWASVNALIAGLTNLNIETEQEDDGRIIAEISALPGCLVYGQREWAAKHKDDLLKIWNTQKFVPLPPLE